MTSLLVDTHVLLWFLSNDSHLPKGVKLEIESTENCLVSVASIWEIGIKKALGKLELGFDLKELTELVKKSGFDFLPITTEHVVANQDLKFFHRDPFDRIIIAQALCEKLIVVTKDKEFKNYNVPLFWQT